MPAELSVPITSRGNIQNGGKEGDSTIQSEPGLDLRARRQLETEFNAFWLESQRIAPFGELASLARGMSLNDIHLIYQAW
jgi:hypothetical protein